MNAVTLTLAAVLFALGACKPRPHAPGVSPARAGESEAPTAPRNPHVFAADGMCSDKLVAHFKSHQRLHLGILNTLNERLADYKKARARVGHSRYFPDQALEDRAAERLKETYAFWRDVYTPFNRRYGTFWCMRRDDMVVLSSAEVEDGIDKIWATVKHLGPLPPPQNFMIGD